MAANPDPEVEEVNARDKTFPNAYSVTELL